MHLEDAKTMITEGVLDNILDAMDCCENSGDMVTFGHTITLRAIIELARAELKRKQAAAV